MLAGSAELKAVIQQTAVRNLYGIGSNIHMAGLAIELVNQDRREYYIRDAFSPLEGSWDYIIIDCPPSLGLVTINAMVWANEIIIPMQSEYFAMEGLTLLMHTIGNIKKSLNPELEVLGILFTMYSKRTRLSRDVVDDIVSYFDDLVFNTMIPRNIRLAEAPSHGLPINQYDSSCNGARRIEHWRRRSLNVESKRKIGLGKGIGSLMQDFSYDSVLIRLEFEQKKRRIVF